MTPLNGIINCAELLLTKCDKFNGKINSIAGNFGVEAKSFSIAYNSNQSKLSEAT